MTATLLDHYVTITRSEYEKLLNQARKLRALEAGGVDNWEGFYESTKHLYNDEDEEQND